ncbi:helix-turn-helix domain-containing protein [Peptacetobacter sp.]
MISSLRKDRGMTQLDLAKKMGVTDKAVSKWERDLSFPDINSIPKLAEIFDVSVDELMQVKSDVNVGEEEVVKESKFEEVMDVAPKGIGLAMGIAVTVLAVLGELEMNTAFIMLGIGLASVSISLLKNK